MGQVTLAFGEQDQTKLRKKVCDACPMRAKCTAVRNYGRLIIKFIDDYFEQVEILVTSPIGKTLLKQRRQLLRASLVKPSCFTC
ncbi:MAG: hypothetical protein GXO93_01930 [FCB group bacterium]|nr:hypothetical protein [FCB group bacterium]